MALNTTLVKSTVVAALGGLLFGFDTAVIAGATAALTSTFDLSPNRLGITVSIALWGTVAGALLASIPGDRYGRRDSLRGMAVFYLVSALGCAFATNWYALLVFRFIGGLAIGGSSVLGPLYITEIAPAKWRGRLVGFFQFNVVTGILLAYLSNYMVGLSLAGSAIEWRWKLGVSAVPAALFFLMLFTIPRSPRWLARKGRIEEARAVLEAIGEENIDSELGAMKDAFEEEKREGQEGLFTGRYALPLLLAISIAMFNQLSGINAILYYLNDIFAKAGFSKVSADLQAVAIGATNLLFTMLAMSIIDQVGRRTLMLIGSVGTALSLAGVAAIFWTGQNERFLVWLLIGFIAAFAFSQGAVIWVYISEVFPTAVRARGQSLGSSTHWVMNALISWAFPIVATYSKAAPFVLFSAMMALQFFVVLFVYPETKNVVLEDMEKKLSAV
jgi:SP family arabinose:H+ symporter-like MFS transporter